MSFQKRLESGEFVVLAEMNTPKGVDISRFVTEARRIKGRVDAVVVPDMDNGVMRMSALAGAVLIQQQGLEAILHIYGRDRNRMALQGDLLAAHVLGVQNLIVVPGEDMSQSDQRDAMPVNDLDELDLLRTLATLQGGQDLAGFDLEGTPQFHAGCTLPAWNHDGALAKALEQAKLKIDAGARFVVTPPVFDAERFADFYAKAASLGVPVIPTVFLIKSVAVARYIATNEPGAHLSEDLIKRIRKSKDREMEGVKIAGETVAALKGIAQGVLIQTMGWEHRLAAVLETAGI
ncbi:MAG: methylenetetrahydrofolate reductase [Desulfobacterales bacterium]